MPKLFLARVTTTFTIISAIAVWVGCGNVTIPTGPSCNNANGIGGFTVHISDINSNGVVVGEDAQGSAYGNFASGLGSPPLQGCASSFGSSSNFLKTPYTLQYGEAPALWSGAFKASCINPITQPGGAGWSTTIRVGDPVNPNGGGPLNMLGSCNPAAAQSFFQLAGSIPTTLTIPGRG